MNSRNISIDNLLKESAKADFQEKVVKARSRKLSVLQIRQALREIMRSKVWHLNNRGTDVDTQERHLAALVKADELLQGSGNGTGHSG